MFGRRPKAHHAGDPAFSATNALCVGRKINCGTSEDIASSFGHGARIATLARILPCGVDAMSRDDQVAGLHGSVKAVIVASTTSDGTAHATSDVVSVGDCRRRWAGSQVSSSRERL